MIHPAKKVLLQSGLVLGLLTGASYGADDVASAVVGTVKVIDKTGKTVVIKVADGSEQTVHFVGKTTVHGAEATGKGAKEAWNGMKEGDEVIVHYTEKGAVKTAKEVDHVGKEGLKMGEVAVKSVNKGAKTVTVKTAEGAEETYHMTAEAGKETGKGLDKAGKATVYYTEVGGKKVIHFFKQS